MNDCADNIESLSAADHNKHHKTGTKHRADSRAKTSATLKRLYAEGIMVYIPRDQCGELNPCAKLTNAQAMAIRSSSLRNSVLAVEFNVSRRTIRNIKTGISWKGQ